jgi:hypothetical protein
MHLRFPGYQSYGGNAQREKSATDIVKKETLDHPADLLSQKQKAIEEERALADVQKLWKWAERTTNQQDRKETTVRTFIRQSLHALHPWKGKNPLGACHDLEENFFSRPHKLPPAQMRIAFGVLLERYRALGQFDRHGYATGDKKGIARLPATDAQIEPHVRRAMLQCLLDRRYALQEGTALNGENEKAAVLWVLSDMLRTVTKEGLRRQFMAQAERLFQKNNGPFTREVLQQWKTDILRSSCGVHSAPSTFHWHEFDRATAKKIPRALLHPMPLLHNDPTLQDLTGLMTDLIRDSAPGTGCSMAHHREAYFSTLPLFYKATEVTSNGIVRVGLNLGITRGRDATLSLFNTGSELQLLIHTGATTQAVTGVKGCVSLDFGGPVAYGGVTVGGDMAYTYARGTHAGTLIRLSAADGAGITGEDKRRFIQLVKDVMTPPDLALTSDDRVKEARARLAQIQSDFPDMKIDRVDKLSSDHHFFIGGSLWGGLDLLFNKGIAPGAGVEIAAAIQYQKSGSVENRKGNGVNTTIASKASRVSAQASAGVAGGNLSGATTTHIRVLAGAGTSCHKNSWRMTKSPAEALTCTESEGILTGIVRTRKFDSKSGFLGAIENILASNPSENPASAHKDHARVRLEEVRRQVMQLQEEHADGGKLAFELVQELRPDCLAEFNRLRAATFHSAYAGNRKTAQRWRNDADKLLEMDSAFHALSANVTLKNAQARQRNVGFIFPIGSSSRTAGSVEHRIARLPLWEDPDRKQHILHGDPSPIQDMPERPPRKPIQLVDRHQIPPISITPRRMADLDRMDAGKRTGILRMDIHQKPVPTKAPRRMADLHHAASRLRNRQQLSVDCVSSKT